MTKPITAHRQSSPSTLRSRSRSRVLQLLAVPFAAVLAVFGLAAPAAASECSVRSQYQGEGWFAAYMCYGLEMIGDGNCFEENGHYWVVTVWCGDLAVVEVTA